MDVSIGASWIIWPFLPIASNNGNIYQLPKLVDSLRGRLIAREYLMSTICIITYMM